MLWTNQFLFLIWKRIFIWKRCGIKSCITNTFFIDSWSSPANSGHCNCRLALGQLPQQGPQLAGAEKFCIRFFSKRELWNLKDCPSGHWHDNDMLGGYDDDMSKIWWYVNRIYDQTWWLVIILQHWHSHFVYHGQLSKTKIKCWQNLNDCPSGHSQEGLPLPHGFPGSSPHFLLSMSDLRMIAMIMMVMLTVFETLQSC